MTAVTDFTQICTILKGSAPTNAQIGKVADLFAKTPQGATSEQRAASAIAGMRAKIRAMLREPAEGDVYAAVIRQAHLPADQPALLAAARAGAIAAGDAAEGNL